MDDQLTRNSGIPYDCFRVEPFRLTILSPTGETRRLPA